MFQVFYLFLENFDSENNLSMDLSEVNNDHLFLNKISLSSFEGHEIKELDIEEIHSSKKLKSNNAIKSAAHYLSKHYRPSRICSLGFIFKRLPFLDWIRTYNLKEFFLKDLIAGFIVIIFLLRLLKLLF